MPNPYHDDQGRFCSKEGMQKSIVALIAKGDTATAHRMKKELDYYEMVGATEPDETRVLIFKTTVSLNNREESVKTANILTAQEVSDADLKEVAKQSKEELARYEAARQKAQADLDALNGELQAERNNPDVTVAQLGEKVTKSHNEKVAATSDLKQFIREEARAAGISDWYMKSYLERKAPALGFEAYRDPNTNRLTPPVPFYELDAKSPVWNSTTRPAENRNIIKAIAKKAEEQGYFDRYNTSASEWVESSAGYRKYGDRYTAIVRELADNETKIKLAGKRIQAVKDAQEWRAQMKAAGFSKYAQVKEARQIVPASLTADDKGTINNAYAFNAETGVGERIVNVKNKMGVAQSVGVMVGESGREYYSATHYANHKRTDHVDYIVLDATKKGVPYTPTNKYISGFHYEMDSSG